MRVFLGIKASPHLQAEIAAWQEDHKKVSVRFLSPENLHMTLVPPWDAGNIDAVIEKMREAAKEAKGFEIVFNTVALGPSPERPNLIWATAQESKEGSAFAAHLKKEFGMEDSRLFKPHVTIARLGHSIPILVPEYVTWPEHAANICLFQSHGNSEYTVLERIDLQPLY